MTLQQLRYLIAVAENGSISAAANSIYASQSNLSIAIRDLESELGITIFNRSNRGVTLTNEGSDLLAYARQIIEQTDMLEMHFTKKCAHAARLAVSAQHYAFSVRAFIDIAESCDAGEYDFIMRETATNEIISDVRNFRSDIGVLYLSKDNVRALRKAFADAKLRFTALFEAPVHVFVGEEHPLAKKKRIRPEELADYPRYSFEQGTANSFYFSEEPLAQLPHGKNIRISDRATLTSLLTDFEGYTLSTGILTPEMQSGIASIPLDTNVTMTVGYIVHTQRKPSKLMKAYIAALKKVIAANKGVKQLL